MEAFRQRLIVFFESDRFHHAIVVLIVFNSILIGLETSPAYMNEIGFLIDQVDLFILGLFILELAVKVFAYRMRFFKDPWNLFDLSIIVISILPAAGSFAVFRSLRIIRALRLINNIPKLKIIIESLLHAIPSIGWISILLSIVFYTYAVIGTYLFGASHPELFGSLGKTFFSLFQVMTLESWSSLIARPIMDGMPWAAIYFVSFILIATYTTLNIFIAIVVNTMDELKQSKSKQASFDDVIHVIRQENAKLREEMDELKQLSTLKNREIETLNYKSYEDRKVG